jgi:quercetin dioxygenase-like cupin family protein
MLKYFSICVAFVTLGTGSLNAQYAQHAQQGQQEATLQKVEVPGAGFDIVLAMPKSQTGATFDFGNSPDATIIYLIGGELALSFDGPENMLQALDSLQLPVGAFHVDSKDSKASKPVAVYIVPNGEMLTSQ